MMSERCWMCKEERLEAELRHLAGVGWRCVDKETCRIARRLDVDSEHAALRAENDRLRTALTVAGEELHTIFVNEDARDRGDGFSGDHARRAEEAVLAALADQSEGDPTVKT